MKLFLNILFFLLPVAVFAQKADTTKLGADSIKNKYMPTGLRVGFDLISLAKSNYVKSFTGWEINSDVNFGHYFLAGDFGSWGRNYTYDKDNGRYKNSGNYYRIGVDVNFLKKDPDKNLFFIGMRYGHSKFTENFVTDINDPFWGSVSQKHYNNTDIKGHWLELTSGIRVKMWKFIWMGYTARFKFGLKTSDTQEMIPSDVPGFGRTDKTTTWGFNYQIFVRLPLRKKK